MVTQALLVDLLLSICRTSIMGSDGYKNPLVAHPRHIHLSLDRYSHRVSTSVLVSGRFSLTVEVKGATNDR